MTKDSIQTYRQIGLKKFLYVYSKQYNEDSQASGKKMTVF